MPQCAGRIAWQGAGAIAKPLRRRYRLAHATDATDRAGASELSPGLMPSRLFSEIPLVLRSGSWFGISTRELKARHLHSLIAIFCPRQHHFRPITLVTSSDDSFGMTLADLLFVRSRPVSGYQIFCATEFWRPEVDSEKAEWIVIWPRKR